MPKFEIGRITTYYDNALIVAESEMDAMRIARELDEAGEALFNDDHAEAEYVLLTEVVS